MCADCVAKVPGDHLRYADAQYTAYNWDFLRRRREECDFSKEANQNKDSIRGCTPNVKESAGRLVQQSLRISAMSRCSNVGVQKSRFTRSRGIVHLTAPHAYHQRAPRILRTIPEPEKLTRLEAGSVWHWER